MSDCRFQFHALNQEVFSFVKEVQRKQSPFFVIAADDLRIKNYEKVSDVNKIEIYENRNIFFISRKNDIIENGGRNCLIIFCGREDNTSIQESYMTIRGENEEFLFWKKIIHKFKKTMLHGGSVYNPVTHAKEYYKHMYYTLNVQKAYKNNVKIRPLAGWNYYILEQEI